MSVYITKSLKTELKADELFELIKNASHEDTISGDNEEEESRKTREEKRERRKDEDRKKESDRDKDRNRDKDERSDRNNVKSDRDKHKERKREKEERRKREKEEQRRRKEERQRQKEEKSSKKEKVPAPTNNRMVTASQKENNTSVITNEIKTEPVNDESREQPAPTNNLMLTASQKENNNSVRTDEIKTEPGNDASREQLAQVNNQTTTALAGGARSLILRGEIKAKYIHGKQPAPTNNLMLTSSQKDNNTSVLTDEINTEDLNDASREKLAEVNNQTTTALAGGSRSLVLRGEIKAKNIHGEQSPQTYDTTAFPTESRTLWLPGERKNKYVYDQYIGQLIRGCNENIENEDNESQPAPTNNLMKTAALTNNLMITASQKEYNTSVITDEITTEPVNDASREQLTQANNQTATALAGGARSLKLDGARSLKLGGARSLKLGGTRSLKLGGEIKAKSIHGEQSPQKNGKTVFPTERLSLWLPGERKNDYIDDQYIRQSLSEKRKSGYGDSKCGEQQGQSQTQMVNDNIDNDNQIETERSVSGGTLKTEYASEEQGQSQTQTVNDNIDNDNQIETERSVSDGTLKTECAYEEDGGLNVNIYSKQIDLQDAELIPPVTNLQLGTTDLKLIEKEGLPAKTKRKSGRITSHTMTW